jgi:hypothetical protein
VLAFACNSTDGDGDDGMLTFSLDISSYGGVGLFSFLNKI